MPLHSEEEIERKKERKNNKYRESSNPHFRRPRY